MVKNLTANAGDTGSTPGSGRSPGDRNGNPFQYCCLENPMDRCNRSQYGYMLSLMSPPSETSNPRVGLGTLTQVCDIITTLILKARKLIHGEVTQLP